MVPMKKYDKQLFFARSKNVKKVFDNSFTHSLVIQSIFPAVWKLEMIRLIIVIMIVNLHWKSPMRRLGSTEPS